MGEGGDGDRPRAAFARRSVASTMLVLALGTAPALARLPAEGAAPPSSDPTSAPASPIVHDPGVRYERGEDRAVDPEPASDGIADWIAPRVADAPPPWSFPTAGTRHELRALFGTVDGARFVRHLRDVPPSSAPYALAGIGFPQVETVRASGRRHQRRYTRLLDWRGERVPHARVRCMNLPSHVVARRAARYAPTIERLADAHGMPRSLVMAVIARESCFDPAAVSRAGAIGLMQLMPATARELREGDPRKPANNLRAGVRYLAAMHELFGSTELALAAYNAGPGNVRRYGGIPPFAETRTYVEKVLAYARRYRALELVASL